jgi:hypothetical protein
LIKRCRAGNQETCIFLENNTQPITEPDTTVEVETVSSTNSESTQTESVTTSTTELESEPTEPVTTYEPTTEPDTEINPCEGIMNGTIPHNDDCTKYVRCSNEK